MRTWKLIIHRLGSDGSPRLDNRGLAYDLNIDFIGIKLSYAKVMCCIIDTWRIQDFITIRILCVLILNIRHITTTKPRDKIGFQKQQIMRVSHYLLLLKSTHHTSITIRSSKWATISEEDGYLRIALALNNASQLFVAVKKVPFRAIS